MERKKQLDEATERLADLIEGHLAKLPPAERKARSRAFSEVVAKVGTRARSEEPVRVQQTPPAVRRRA
jgi:hypothetical protein